MKVIVVGAGISGIITAIKLQESIQNLQLSIYDKNPEVGGTWWENRYPGCACGTSFKEQKDRRLGHTTIDYQ